MSNSFLIKESWIKEMKEHLRLMGKTPSDEVLSEIFDKNFYDPIVELKNNYEQTSEKTTLSKVYEDLETSKPIITEGGTVFYNQKERINLNADMISDFLVKRKVFKKKMSEAQDKKNFDEMRFYDIRQKVYKIFANSIYGVYGQVSSIFYNLFVAEGITSKGQALISTAATSFEKFLHNNVKLTSVNELLYFIERIINEKYKIDIKDIINVTISDDDFCKALQNICKFKITDIILKPLLKLNNTDRLKIVCKNNLNFVINNSDRIKLLLKDIIANDIKFENPNKPPVELKDIIFEAWFILKEIVFYNYLAYNKLEYLRKEKTKTVILVDTDSNVLNLLPTIQFFNSIAGIPESEDTNIKTCNILTTFLTEMLKDVFITFCQNSNNLPEYFHYINMKNEFMFKKIFLTNNKKNYAFTKLYQEGIRLDNEFEMKGLSIKKTNTNRYVRKVMTDILENDIMKADEIDVKVVLSRLNKLKNEIRQSLLNGETKFYSPAKCNDASSYEKPLTQSQYRATIAWNILFPDKEMNLPAELNVVKMLIDDKEALDKYISPSDPLYDKILSILNDPDMGKYGLVYLGLPKNIDRLPDSLIPCIDVDTIVRDSMKNFLIILESLGIKPIEITKDKVSLSNIIDM